MTDIEKLRAAIEKAHNICVFTGAGISCPSGIPDFRSADGLYSGNGTLGYTPEQIISHSFFVRHTKEFYDFYKSKMIYADALPNSAHKYFADLEKQGKKVSVVTQNIDGLHSDAGSTEVYEIHGSVRRNYCTKCGAFYNEKFIVHADGVPVCEKCGAVVKPDVVLYEEQLDDAAVRGALNAIMSADLLIVVGTSLTVYPAASFVGYFRGETLAVINKGEFSVPQGVSIAIYSDITEVVAQLCGN